MNKSPEVKVEGTIYSSVGDESHLTVSSDLNGTTIIGISQDLGDGSEPILAYIDLDRRDLVRLLQLLEDLTYIEAKKELTTTL